MSVRHALLLVLLLAPRLAQAACSVDATPVAFGAYGPFNAIPTDTAGSLRVSCDAVTVGYTLVLSPGGAGSYSPRQLSGGAYSLAYNLYADTLRTAVWGDGSGGTITVSGAFALPGIVEHTVYGRVFPRQNIAPGSYSDAITVTINF